MPDLTPEQVIAEALLPYFAKPQNADRCSRGVLAATIAARVVPLIERREVRERTTREIVEALRAKGTHAADVLADQIEGEAP